MPSTRAPGGPGRISSTSSATASSLPSTATRTAPESSLRTQPASPRARACCRTNQRNPTPCTAPVTSRWARAIRLPGLGSRREESREDGREDGGVVRFGVYCRCGDLSRPDGPRDVLEALRGEAAGGTAANQLRFLRRRRLLRPGGWPVGEHGCRAGIESCRDHVVVRL